MKTRLGSGLRRMALSLRLDNYAEGCEKMGIYAGQGAAKQRLELIVRTVFAGYHLAIDDPAPENLQRRLAGQADWERSGFLYEGAGMGLALMDFLDPLRRDRLGSFACLQTAPSRAALSLGCGLASARIPWARRGVVRRMNRFDAATRWLMIDAFAFHDGLFHIDKVLRRRRRPKYIVGYARRVFDQGLGRSLWFSQGGDVRRVVAALSRFPNGRADDLWSGVGFGAAYAGGVDREALTELAEAAGSRRRFLGVGAALAAYHRAEWGNEAVHTDAACRAFCRRSAALASDLARESWEDAAEAPLQPAYAQCRSRIAAALADSAGEDSQRVESALDHTYGGN